MEEKEPRNTQLGTKASLLRLSPRKPRNTKNLSLDLSREEPRPLPLLRSRTGSSSSPYRPSIQGDQQRPQPLQRRKTTLALTIPTKKEEPPDEDLVRSLTNLNISTAPSASSVENAYPNGPVCVYEPGLYLYSEPKAEQLAQFDIVINVAKELPNLQLSLTTSRNSATYHFVPWQHTSQICQDFPRLVEVIESGLAQHRKILIHCQCGISRSASLIVAFLMKHEKLNLNDAYNMLKQKAPLISPNMTLIFQLMEWNSILSVSNSSSHSQPNSPIKVPVL